MPHRFQLRNEEEGSDGGTDDGIEESETKDGNGNVAHFTAIFCWHREAAVEAVDAPPNQSSPEEANGDVARIVHA